MLEMQSEFLFHNPIFHSCLVKGSMSAIFSNTLKSQQSYLHQVLGDRGREPGINGGREDYGRWKKRGWETGYPRGWELGE